MRVDAKFGAGEFEVINQKWITTPVDPDDCVSSRINNGCWGYGMGIPGGDLSYLGNDFVEFAPNDGNAHLFINGIYSFAQEGRVLFKNISLEVCPLIGRVDSWRCADAEISVVDGVVKDLDPSPEYGMDAVRNIMMNFGYSYCDMSILNERYEEECVSGECVVPFCEWLASLDDDDIMDPDQLEEAEWDGPHWWYGDFLYGEVREWIYEGVSKWRKERLDHLSFEIGS